MNIYLVRLHLHPHYVSLPAAAQFSPKLFELFNREKVELVRDFWNGMVESLPAEPSLIRASSRMNCTWEELGQKCAELGHLCFYDDQLVLPSGELSKSDALIEAAKKFIEKHKAA